MKAIAKCPKCKKLLETDCYGCIESKTAVHSCKNQTELEIVENIKWKVTPETEEESKKLLEEVY